MTEEDRNFRFGRFQLVLDRRELRAGGVPVNLGSRAFDLLALLVQARGTVVAKDEILRSVWPGVIVEDGNLQVQISILRRVLGEHRDAIRTVPGRGYAFVAPAVQETEHSPDSEGKAAAHWATNLPAAMAEFIGRESEVADLTQRVTANRMMTLTGPGGIGKTRLALEIARTVMARFADGVWLVELAPISDPDLVSSAVATVFGLAFSAGPISAERVAQALAGKQLLLLLDNCEHVVDAAARLAEALLRVSPRIHVLATSREPLRIDGESVARIQGLSVPADETAPAAELLKHGAVRLFMTLAQATEPDLPADAHTVATAAAVCRHLDGIALAIELAASRVPTLGIDGLAARLDDRFALLTGGRRTALPRQQTLRATIDWSYDTLDEVERAVFRRLSVFAATFTLEAASAVGARGEIAAAAFVETIAALAAKSLLIASVRREGARYRLLETIRAYALEKLAESGELDAIGRRHAECVRDLLVAAQRDWEELPAAAWLPTYRGHLADIRAALDWAFSGGGDSAVGVDLLVAAVPLWLHLSLMEECRTRTERALAILGPAAREPTRRNMQLHAARGFSLMYTQGAAPETGAALETVLAMADRLDDDDYRMRSLWGLWVHRLNNGAIGESFELARKFSALAERSADAVNLPVGDRMLGFSLYFLGDLAGARRHLEHMARGSHAAGAHAQLMRYQLDQWITGRITLAEVLWLLGFPDRALRMAEDGVGEAVALGHALTLCNALAKACPVALYAGDLAAAERFVDMLLDHAGRHALAFWLAEARCCKGMLLVTQGETARGAAALHAALAELPSTRFNWRYTTFLGVLAHALGSTGDVAQGLATVDAALARADGAREGWCTAELMRIRGVLLRRQGAPGSARAAEQQLRRSLEIARGQGALSWELRAAATLFGMLRDEDRDAEARDILAGVYGRFSEGFATADLRRAKALLDGAG